VSSREYFSFDFFDRNFNRNFESNQSEIKSEVFTNDINDINIEWTRGDVKILKSSSSETRAVQKSPGGMIKNTMTAYVSGDKLVIDDNNDRRFSFFNFGLPQKTHLELYLPEKLYKSVKINNVSGDINCDDISSETLNITTISGDIALSGKSDWANFENVSGRLRVSSFICPRVRIEIVSGSAYLTGVFDDITSEVVSGSIVITSSNMPGRLQSSAVSGSVTLNIPENDGFELTFSKVSGSFNSDFALTSSGNTYIYKNGASRFRFEVVSGNVNVFKQK